ncbi:MAG: hypothetical protein KY455_06410 [Euryarchaeota archaeon]|nr:hypothetical protein [Euryarchaeota archaeon]
MVVPRPSSDDIETDDRTRAVKVPRREEAPAVEVQGPSLAACLPRLIILPAMDDPVSGPVPCPSARAIRFPSALTPVLAASLGQLGDPAILTALRPGLRAGYATRQVGWMRSARHVPLHRLASRTASE